MTAVSTKVLVSAAGLGTLIGVVAYDTTSLGWIFTLLVFSAVVVAALQQTLP